MNIEEKTKLAHEYLRDIISNWDFNDSFNPVSEAWEYADAMEAEAEKRIKVKSEKDAEESKVIFKSLRENEDGSCKHFHTTLNRGECFDCGEKLNSTDSSQLEWQPDWSVAPDGFDWWAMDEDMTACWYCVEPYIDDSIIKQWDYDNHKCHKKVIY